MNLSPTSAAANGGNVLTAPEVSPIVEEPESWFVVAGQTTYFTARVAAQPGDSVEWISTGGAASTASCGLPQRRDGDIYLCRVDSVSLAQDGTQFAIEVKREGQAVGFQSKFASLSVAAAPVAPTLEAEPTSQTVPAGQEAVFTARASGTGVNPVGSVQRDAAMRWRWFRDGVPIGPPSAGRSSTLRLQTTADEANTQSVISVKIYNAAGIATSQDADLVVTAASTVVNADGGTVPGPAGSRLEVPPNSLEGVTTIAITAEPVPADLLPAGYIAVGQMLNFGAPSVALAQPARLSFQGPAVVPAGMQLAVLPVEDSQVAASRGKAASAAFSIGSIDSCQNSQNSSATAQVNALISRLRRIVVALVPATECPEVQPRIPPDVVPSTTQAPCQRSDDFTVTSGVGSDEYKTLVSRHVDCRESELRFVTLSIDLKETVSNTGEARYSLVSDPKTLLPDDVVRNVPYATVLLKSRMSVHGSSEGLSKRINLAIKALTFVKDINYAYYAARGAPSPSSFVVKPEIGGCITYDGSDQPSCTVPGKPELTVSRSNVAARLARGNAAPDEPWPDGIDFSMTFKWTKSAEQAFDSETFRININRFEYKFPGGSYFLARSGTPLQTNWFWGSLGESPKLRCDRGLAEDGTSNGCVFVEAAPVFDLRQYPVAAEATAHVKAAQDGTSQSIAPLGTKSQGKFKFKPGSIAVADSSVTGSEALQLLKDKTIRSRNRFASCTAANPESLIRTREPFHGSASCPGPVSPGTVPSGCSCDEYPMASTWQGAHPTGGSNANRVSVKYIVNRANSSQGGGIGAFYEQFFKRERVLDLTEYGVLPIRPSGDDFWVNARDPEPAKQR